VTDPARVHGGLDASELSALGLDARAVLDLSVNINPLGPHPAVLASIQRASVARYPQPWAAGARAALAGLCEVDSSQVVVGHGSTELIWSAISLCARDPRPLLIVAPTFSEPLLAASAYGVLCVEHRLQLGEALDLNQLSRAIEQHDAQAVYVCQPNNPDGSCVPAAHLRELCSAHPACFFIVDQAFLSLSTRHEDLGLKFPDNVLLVRSLTKEHAMPGLRAGYAVSSAANIARLNAQRPSWMVSALAEAAIVEACAQHAYVARARALMLEQCAALADACRELGYRVVPSTTTYFVMHVGAADQFRKRLLARHAIAVRSCASFGCPDYVRIAGCATDRRLQLLAALEAERGMA
jgi:histidinol-phosphate/aromatic aminotransferase/cobyric acid decarboxylase-like protein